MKTSLCVCCVCECLLIHWNIWSKQGLCSVYACISLFCVYVYVCVCVCVSLCALVCVCECVSVKAHWSGVVVPGRGVTRGEHEGLPGVVAIRPHSQVHLLGVGVALERLRHPENRVWGSHLHLSPPGADTQTHTHTHTGETSEHTLQCVPLNVTGAKDD